MPKENKDPKTANGWYLLGLRHAEQKKYAEAMNAFEKATALDPKSVGAWNNLGITRRQQGDLVGAIAAFARALALNPDDIAARNNMERARKEHKVIGEAEDQERHEKLKKLVRVSTKMKISQIGECLGLVGKDLLDKLVDWADSFGFVIDEDVVDFEAGRKDAFIAELEAEFASWGKKGQTGKAN